MGQTLRLFETKFSDGQEAGLDGRPSLLGGHRPSPRRRRRLRRRLLRLLLHRPLLAEKGPEKGRPVVDLSKFFKL